MSRRRTALLVLFAAAAAGTAFFTYRTDPWDWQASLSNGRGGQGRPPPRVETARVRSREVETRAAASGTLIAPEAVVITTEATGRVAEVRFEEGVRVDRGEVLVRLDRQREEAQVREAEARVRQLRRQESRQVELYAEGFVSDDELERTEAALEEAEAALAIAREALDDRSIEAPFGGLIGRRLVSPGALVEPGTPITRLTQAPELELLFEIPEKQIAGLRPGLEVRVTTPAYPNETFSGEVTFVSTELNRDTRTLPVEASLPNADGRLKPGMFVAVALVLSRREAITVPEAAVISRGPSHFVYRVEGSRDGVAVGQQPMGASDPPHAPRVVRQTVEIGQRRDGWLEVLSGLGRGDQVVAAGHGALRDGMRVRTGAYPGAASDGSPIESLARQGPAQATAGRGSLTGGSLLGGSPEEGSPAEESPGRKPTSRGAAMGATKGASEGAP